MQQIKKRKGVGLRAARKDKDGKDLVRAEDAENGRTYYCPFCGTDMHVTHPHNGVPIFVLYAKGEHRHPICREILRTGKIHSLEMSTPEDLMSKLTQVHKQIRHQQTIENKNSSSDNENEDILEETEDQDLPVEKIAFSKLSQIWEYGLNNFHRNERFGDYTIQDYILYFPWFDSFFENGILREICGRIIEGRLSFKTYYRKGFGGSFVFSVYKKGVGKISIIAIAKNKDIYDRCCKNLFKTGYNKQDKPILKPYARDCLIVSTKWHRFLPDDCHKKCPSKEEYCKNCYGCYVTILTGSSNIYVGSYNDEVS